jgi:purine-cytosine permease-like protein
MVVSSFAIGALAIPIFSLGFVDTALTIIFINLLGIMPVCYFSTFGPRFGLRQMVLSRFWFGWYGVKLSRTSCGPSSYRIMKDHVCALSGNTLC